MAVVSRVRTELARQWRDREINSPDRTKVWAEPKPPKDGVTTPENNKRVPVVYYLTRNGHLEHPHFMEVALSVSDGLYLRDVIDRLNFLRGKGMASMYSWSSKRSYKNGFVWHDLTEDDFIYPAHGQEYVLKGSELVLHLQNRASPPPCLNNTDSAASSSSGSEKEMSKSTENIDSDCPLARRKKKTTAWGSLDLGEYKVYKADSMVDPAFKAADASTQTDDRRQWRRAQIRNEDRSEVPNPEETVTTELCREEISPPPPSSSPETLESLIKSDVRARIATTLPDDRDRMVGLCPSGRARASAVLINLISCGSISVKDQDLSMVPNYRVRLARGTSVSAADEAVPVAAEEKRRLSMPWLEDKEYFSGSLIETKKKASDGYLEFSSLKRSSSYNADRSSKIVELCQKETEVNRAKCIPRKPQCTSNAAKENGALISRSTHGSKRIADEAALKDGS